VLFLLFFQHDLFGQNTSNNYEFRFERITSENYKIEKGLSANTVFSILQDQKGYLWIGTWDGLNKYDGYDFTVFRSDIQDFEKGLSNETIYSLYEDNNGFLWIGTEYGLNKLDRKTKKITKFIHSPTNVNTICNDTIRAIMGDDAGNIWLGTQNGLDKFVPATATFVHYKASHSNSFSLSNNTVYDLKIDNQKNMWIATAKGINKYNPISNNFKSYFYNKQDTKTISNDTVYALCIDKDGFLWAGTKRGLNQFDRTTGNNIRFLHNPKNPGSVAGDQIISVLEDSKGVLWVGTYGNGLDIFNQDSKTFIHYKNSTLENASLSNDIVNKIYEDKSGIIWIATWNGVNKIDKNTNKFKHIYTVSNKNSLNSNIIWSIYKDDKDIIWIATDAGGINLYNRNNGTFQYIRHNPNNQNSVGSDNVRYIFCDRAGVYWIGTYDAGFDKFENGKFEHYTHKATDKNTISNNSVTQIIEDKEGFLWIATYSGLNKFDPQTKKVTVYKNDPNDPFSLQSNVIYGLLDDSKGNLWVGTFGGGLSLLDKKTGKCKTYKHDHSQSNCISSNRVFSIFEDKQGVLWVCTMGGGLNKFDPKTGMFKSFTKEKNGIADNVVYSILEDKNSNLWMSTNNGISRFNKKEESFINYNVKEGVQSNEFNQAAAFISKDGEMFFGGMNGFNSFFPQEIKKNGVIPNVVISKFKIFNNIINDELADGDVIELNYFENFFSFEFSALEFTNPAKNKFAYKLENIDKKWNYVDANHRYAEYTNINPGKYYFHVKACNNDGVWNEKGTTIVLIINTPWWKTWSFRLLVLFVMIAIISSIIAFRINQIKKKNKIEKKMLTIEKQLFELEQKSLRMQMNPHFIFNSLNSIQSFILTNDTDRAINYLGKFSQLIRLILSNSRESFIPVKDEIQTLQYYLSLEQLRFENEFDYTITVDEKIDDEFICIPPMLIQPFVENAILHGILHRHDKGIVNISLTLKENSILCIIEDNGVGRARAQQIKNESGLKHKSRGMVITKERLDILNKQSQEQITVHVTDLKDDKGNATGTRVEILIPVSE